MGQDESQLIFDVRTAAKRNGKVYKMVMRPVVMYVLGLVALTKPQGAKLEVVELKMLRFSLRVSRSDRIRYEYIRFSKVNQARLRWFGMRGILVILDKNFEYGTAKQVKKGRSQRM